MRPRAFGTLALMDLPGIGWFVALGFVAQLIDGALGMAYGTLSSTVLLALGVPPAVASATVHAAEVATTGVSATAHAAFRNIDRRAFVALAVPGVVGGVLGALALAHLPGETVKPWVAAYLAVLGVVIVVRAWRGAIVRREPRHTPFLGFAAGALDAIGGGGWGALTTSTLILEGLPPRYAVGTANAAEFLVATSIAITLGASIGLAYWHAVLGLLAGGVVAAPLAAYAARAMPQRATMLVVGSLVALLSGWTLARSL
jgi:hypothetical protein